MLYLQNTQLTVPVRPTAAPWDTYTQGRAAVSAVRVRPRDACSWRVTLSRPEYVVQPPAMTVQFNDGVGILGSAYYPLLARVTWGSQGVQHVADVDWGNGRTFVVHGDYVQVEAICDARVVITAALPPPFGVRTGEAPAIQCGATITPCGASVSADDVPTRTLFTGDIGPLVYTFFPVPRYARRFRWHQVINTSPGVWVGSTGTPQPIEVYTADTMTPTLVNSDTPTEVLAVDGYCSPTTSYRSWPGGGWYTMPGSARFWGIANLTTIGPPPSPPAQTIGLIVEFALSLG